MITNVANWYKTRGKTDLPTLITGKFEKIPKIQPIFFQLSSLVIDDVALEDNKSLFWAMQKQSAPLFRPPLLWRTVQLFFIVFVVYITLGFIFTYLVVIVLRNDLPKS